MPPSPITPGLCSSKSRDFRNGVGRSLSPRGLSSQQLPQSSRVLEAAPLGSKGSDLSAKCAAG